MLSIPWKETLKHQTNFSPCKSTFAFSKDRRFKNKDGVLYNYYYLGATHSTISLLPLVEPLPQAWAEATRLQLSTHLLPLLLLSTIALSPHSKLKRRESSSHLEEKTSNPMEYSLNHKHHSLAITKL